MSAWAPFLWTLAATLIGGYVGMRIERRHWRGMSADYEDAIKASRETIECWKAAAASWREATEGRWGIVAARPVKPKSTDVN